ncbi:MAG: hypothetical protein HOP13_11390 [Alphaproteobacteria bacterium]|nr:hypothetical protein [Alphaproteobacteria bacterium]
MRIGFVFAVLALMDCGNAIAGPAGMNGSWGGEMRQIEVSTELKYPMTLTIKGKVAEADYPTLNCRGSWTRVAEKNGYVIYAEKVTNKKGASCIDGMVMVTLDQGKVFLGWFAADAGEPIVAMAALSKAAR